MVELLKTKLFIPRTRGMVVPRPRLVELLNTGLDKKLTLIAAPAGFGKTTLVVSWLKQTGIPAAWLSLDEADNDLPRFLAYLAAAFQQVDEQVGANLLNVVQASPLPPIEKVLTALLNEVALRKEALVLVLDDYHLLNEPAVLAAMEFLLHHKPPQLNLLLSTREDPDLPLARLRAEDQLTEIRARDLRFNEEEADLFLRGVMGLTLSEPEVAVLEDRTEGWIVGLQLAGISMQNQANLKAFIADFSGSQRHILDYLTDEVLQQQPESTRTFLLQTSVLDRLCGRLCDALTGRSDSRLLLAHLEAANLFVIPLDEERRWYRYHHLFSDLLRSQLTRSQPELVPELHQRASQWLEVNGDIKAAVEHALQAPDLPRAARLIEEQSFPKVYQGQVTMVLGWFDRLPEAVLQSAPMLCICKAWALVLMQRAARRDEVERALQAAEMASERIHAGDVLQKRIAGHTAAIRAFLLRRPALMENQPERLIAISQEALRLLPAEDKAIRSAAALNIGYGYQALADLEAANLAFRQVMEDGLAGGNYYSAIYGPVNLAFSAYLAGHTQEALQLCETNIVRFNKMLAGRYFPPIGALYIMKGKILVEYDSLLEAEQVLTDGLDLVRWTGDAVVPKKGYTALARLRAIQGNRSAAMEAMKTLEETWPEGSLYVQALRHRLLIRHWPDDGDVQRDAYTWLSQSGIKLDEREIITSVDPINRSRFDTNLNAAHVLARLEGEKPEAYTLESVQAYLERQQDFAAAHGFVSWVVDISIARTLLYRAAGNRHQAIETLGMALSTAAPTGLFRIFLDECDLLQDLMEELKPRLADEPLTDYADRLMDAFSYEPAKPEPPDKHVVQLSARELDVLHHLAMGLTYEEIGQQLFLSLNTVQFHVKHIYRKLQVKNRAQAIQKARARKLF